MRVLSSAEQSRRAQHQTGDALRDTGACKTYRKRGGRHEHRVYAEKMLGRKLQAGEIVHHQNGDKRDNQLENLEVMTQSEHARLHFAAWRREKRASEQAGADV